MLGSIWQGCQISPLFHEGAQNFKLINLVIFVGGWPVSGCGGKAGLETACFGVRHPGLVGSPFSCAGLADPLPDQTVLPRQAGDKRDDLLPTYRGTPLMSPGLASGGVVFPKLSKLLNQEDALGAPCFMRSFV